VSNPQLSPAISYSVEHAKSLLSGKRVLALTGAGISTDSGIPDYRGEGRVQKHPLTFDEFMGSERNRARYWARSFVGFRRIEKAQTNPGHIALAQAESSDQIMGIITQNVDGLHQKAGSQNVIELHGRLDQIACVGCGKRISRTEMDDLILKLNPLLSKSQEVEFSPDGDAEIEVAEDFKVPNCSCGLHFKPDVVFFGEQVPKTRVELAESWVAQAEAVLVAGSSLTVNSGLRLVKQAINQGKPAVVVNLGPTKADSLVSVKINHSTSVVLREIFS
jgi:NAD-dependent SIR2 family protein deacetylase